MNKNYAYNFDLFNKFPDMYFLLSEEGKILRMNSVAHKVLNRKKDTEFFSEIFDLVELCDRNEAQILF